MREGRIKQVPKGEIMEGQCSPPSSSSFGTVAVVVVVDVVDVVDVAAAAVWVPLLSRQLQTKAGAS